MFLGKKNSEKYSKFWGFHFGPKLVVFDNVRVFSGLNRRKLIYNTGCNLLLVVNRFY